MSNSIQKAGSTAIGFGADNPFAGFFQSQEAAPPPPPPAGTIMFPFPKIRWNVKEGVKLTLLQMLAADDAEDSGSYFVTAPNFRADMVLIAPIVASYRHVSWHNNKKVTDTPGSLANCEYCVVHANTQNDRDRCENHCELVFAVLNAKDLNNPSSWTVRGIYYIDTSRTSFDEAYNFYYYEMLKKVTKENVTPWSNLYMLGIKNIVGQNTWNVPRIMRVNDVPAARQYYREANKEAPVYKSFPTPGHILQDLNARLLDKNSAESFAVSLFNMKGIDAGAAMKARLGGATTARVDFSFNPPTDKVEVVEAEVVTDEDAVAAFLNSAQ